MCIKLLDKMVKVSKKSSLMPASAIRKLVPFADAAQNDGIKVYHLNVGAPDIKSPECALEAVRKNTLDHVSYTNSAGLPELRKGLAEKYYRSIGIEVSVPEIIITVAGSEAVNLALQIACDEGDELIVIEPFYTNYNTFCFESGIILKAVHTDIESGFKVPPIEEFEKLVTPRTKAILISNPGNPTGTLYSKEDMLALGEVARKHNLFLISDEVYREFSYTDEPRFSAMNIPGLADNVILVDSVSKRYNLCGVRIGCIASHNKDVIAAALKYAQSRLCPPVLGQYATIGALDTPDSYFAEVREEYIRRRDVTIKALNEMPGVFAPTPLGAFYAVAELPIDDAGEFAKWLLTDFRYNNETVQLTPATAFYADKTIKNQVRIAYVLEVPELEKAMKCIAEALKVYPGRTN